LAPTTTPVPSATNTPTGRPTAAGPGTLAYVTVPESAAVAVVDIATYETLATIPVGFGPRFVATTPNGQFAYVTDPSIVVMSVISTATNTVTATVPVGVEARTIAITRDGATAYVMANGLGSVLAIDTATNMVTGSFFLGGAQQLQPRTALALSPNGREVWAGNSDPYGEHTVVEVFDTATKQVTNIGVPGGNTWSIAFSPNGRVVYVTVDLGIAVIDTVTHAITKMITVSGGTPLEVAFTPNGAFAYVTNGGPLVSVIDASTHTEVSTVSIPNSATGVAVSSDGAFVYVAMAKSGSRDPGVAVIDTQTNTVVAAALTDENLFSATDIALASLPTTSLATPTRVVATATPTERASSCGQCTCTGDGNGDGEVTIDEIITAVNNDLSGCPAQ